MIKIQFLYLILAIISLCGIYIYTLIFNTQIKREANCFCEIENGNRIIKPHLSEKTLITNLAEDDKIFENHEEILLLPRDELIDKMNESELTLKYWCYINTLQYFCRNQMRLGPMKDGGKQICIDKLYKPTSPCLVYSFGSNYDFGFEKDVEESFGCEVHTFDPSMAIRSDQAPSYLKFHRIGLASTDDKDNSSSWKMRKLSSILKHLNHYQKTIDVLKIDIEGDEWTTLPEIMQSGQLNRVRQLCLEVHFGWRYPNTGRLETWGNITFSTQLKVLRKLYEHGFRIFMKEYNTYRVQKLHYPNREITNVNEVSFVNINLQYGRKEFSFERLYGNQISKLSFGEN